MWISPTRTPYRMTYSCLHTRRYPIPSEFNTRSTLPKQKHASIEQTHETMHNFAKLHIEKKVNTVSDEKVLYSDITTGVSVHGTTKFKQNAHFTIKPDFLVAFKFHYGTTTIPCEPQQDSDASKYYSVAISVK